MSHATQMQLEFSAKERVLMVMTVLLAPILAGTIYGTILTRKEAMAYEDEAMPQPADLWTAVGISCTIVLARLVLARPFQTLGRRALSPRKRQNPDRIQRFATVLFKFLYFCGITVMGFSVMKDEPWFPVILGGTGDTGFAFATVDTAPSSPLKTYYHVQLGYHLHSLVFLLLLTPARNDFLEMLVHHIATVVLLGSSYLANYTAIGALVAFVHDLGDVTGYAIKSMVDTGHTVATVALYLVLLVSWAYSRLYVFPVHLLAGTLATAPIVRPEVAHSALYYALNALLGMLQLLHVYWYGLFVVMGARLVTRGECEDLQQQAREAVTIRRPEMANAARTPLRKKIA